MVILLLFNIILLIIPSIFKPDLSTENMTS